MAAENRHDRVFDVTESNYKSKTSFLPFLSLEVVADLFLNVEIRFGNKKLMSVWDTVLLPVSDERGNGAYVTWSYYNMSTRTHQALCLIRNNTI